jgi:hypothetical protein
MSPRPIRHQGSDVRLYNHRNRPVHLSVYALEQLCRSDAVPAPAYLQRGAQLEDDRPATDALVAPAVAHCTASAPPPP